MGVSIAMGWKAEWTHRAPQNVFTKGSHGGKRCVYGRKMEVQKSTGDLRNF